MWMALIVAPIQAGIGDAHGLNTLEHQPAKIAAIEGHWHNTPGEPSPLILFGLPDMQAEETKYAVELPYLGSIILTHSLDKQIPALSSFPKDERPFSPVVFWSFRIMVALGLLMITAGVWSLVLRLRRKLYDQRLFHRFVLLMGPSGLLAILAGWFTTEVGRQPWVVYGLLRTRDAVSNHGTLHMSLSLLAFLIVYCSVFGVGTVYLLKLVGRGPQPYVDHPPSGGPGQARTPARPLSAADEALDHPSKDQLKRSE